MRFKHFIKTAAMFLAICLYIPSLSSCNSFSDTEYAIVSENHVSKEGFIYDKYENSTVRITGIEDMPLLLTIPEEIDGMKVVEIGESAFEGNEMLLYLELPSTDIKLGKRFCSGCTSLVSVNLSNSVKTLPVGAFEECRNLSMISGTSALTEISSQAFASCTSLSDLKISDSLVSIGDEAFRGCTSLSAMTLPDTLTFIGEAAFWGCENLVKVTVGGSLSIPKYAFLDCTALSQVILGDNVSSIDEEAFRNCRNLHSITFGKNLNSIANYAFHACDSLTEIVFKCDKSKINISEGNESLDSAN